MPDAVLWTLDGFVPMVLAVILVLLSRIILREGWGKPRPRRQRYSNCPGSPANQHGVQQDSDPVGWPLESRLQIAV